MRQGKAAAPATPSLIPLTVRSAPTIAARIPATAGLDRARQGRSGAGSPDGTSTPFAPVEEGDLEGEEEDGEAEEDEEEEAPRRRW